jgi:hypothetical protein
MTRRAPALDRAALAVEIASLPRADIKELRERWKTLYGRVPSSQIGRSFLIRAIASDSRSRLSAVSNLRPVDCWRGSRMKPPSRIQRRDDRFGRRKPGRS